MMHCQRKYEKLDGLPAYGPMYIPISVDGMKFYNQGLVVRFFKTDGTNWVANFKTGWTHYSNVFEIPSTNTIVVIACGQGYIMTPDQQKPLKTFGHSITEVISTNDQRFVAACNTNLEIINSDATISSSERISLDGIKDLAVTDKIVRGLSFDPLHGPDQWVSFSFHLDTEEITGGSYRCDRSEEVKKPFWKFW